jgi:hypothetical protein
MRLELLVASNALEQNFGLEAKDWNIGLPEWLDSSMDIIVLHQSGLRWLPIFLNALKYHSLLSN